MPGLLLPAYQKLYGALSSLDRFSKDKSFFDNISSLDNFFSEFRNITFVLQKSLAHTEYLEFYKENRDKYLSDCKWFVDKRNETTKEQPFQLVKQIDITIYLPDQGIRVYSQKYTVENDVEICTLVEKFRQMFFAANPIEVFFSAEFSFFENGNSVDIYDELMSGIQKMKTFMSAMKERINEPCELCEKIEQEMKKSKFITVPRDMFLIADYVYYPRKELFERASRVSLVMGGQKLTLPRMSVDCFNKGMFEKLGDGLFEKFVVMHVIQKNTNIMPAIMIVYKDKTFELDAFNADMKTTLYRKINETAKKILTDEVKEVYFMQAYTYCPLSQDLLNMTSAERAGHAMSEILAFMKIDDELNEEEYVFEGKHLSCENYLVNQLKYGRTDNIDVGKNNVLPLIDAFKQK